jgi:signal peptide peptidase SppA
MNIVSRIAATRVFNTELMIDAGKAAAIMNGLGDRFVDGGATIVGVDPVDHVAFANGRPSAGVVGDLFGRRIEQAGDGARILPVVDNVAIITVEGTLVHKGRFLGQSSGETSYEGLQTRVNRARRDPNVKGVVFEVDSFGGEVAGAFDTAHLIAELSAEKPTLAILTDYALSAGYLLAAACRQIVMPRTGAAGSIGVITLIADFTGKLEKEGIKVAVVTSGAFKADGNPALPLDPAVIARAQARVDAARDIFATDVGKFRGGRLTKEAALATEARVYSGGDAVAAGLVDEIVRPNVAFDAFIGEVNRTGRSSTRKPRATQAAASISQEKQRMTQKSGLAAVRAAADPDPALAAESLIDVVPADEARSAADRARAEGEASGREHAARAATDAERARCKAILESEHAAGREALARYFAFDTAFSTEEAVAALAKSPKSEAKTSRLDGLVPSPQVAAEDTPKTDGRAAGLAAAVDSLIARRG